MNHFIKNTALILFMLITLVLFITHTQELVQTVHQSVELWLTRVFPILFPFYILGTLLIQYGIAHLIGELLSPMTSRFFKTKAITGFVLLIAMVSGNPQSAVMIAELNKRGELNKRESEHLLKFCVFANPLFIIGTIGVAYFHNIRIGFTILLAHLLSNLLIGFFLRFSQPKIVTSPKIRPYHQLTTNQTRRPFGEILTETLQKGLNIMILVCGFMIFFNLVVFLLHETKVIVMLHHVVSLGGRIPIPFDLFSSVILGIFEMVRFVDSITNTDLTIQLKVSLIAAMVSFGGLSIHAQIHSVLDKVKIPYRPFFIFRVIQMALSGMLAYILFPFVFQEEAVIEVGSFFQSFHRFNILFIIIFLILLLLIYWWSQRKRPNLTI